MLSLSAVIESQTNGETTLASVAGVDAKFAA